MNELLGVSAGRLLWWLAQQVFYKLSMFAAGCIWVTLMSLFGTRVWARWGRVTALALADGSVATFGEGGLLFHE